MIVRWLKELRFNRSKRRFIAGYDWAAGYLLRGDGVSADISDIIQESRDFGEFDDFDRGAEFALAAWNKFTEARP